ncbi:FecR family protein [Salisaeta longa]|uniref:FecR family protein n=1 Tax=Salisaeta longa TaxID=503170 RepID=UPI0003B76BF2|nr:FecR family protein [Salisaeta longa]
MDSESQPQHKNTPDLPPELERQATDKATSDDYAILWALLKEQDATTDRSFPTDDAWAALEARLSSASDDSPRARMPERASRRAARPKGRTRARWAVVAAMFVCIGFAVLISRPQTTVHKTAVAEQTTVTLPDGSTVTLNAASRLSYPSGFSTWFRGENRARTVTLEGEAFFAIRHRKRPFRVHTPNATIEVLGTRFNVRARSVNAQPITRVALQSGRVKVWATEEGAEDSVLLEASGASSRVVGSSAPTQPVAIAEPGIAAWRNGGLAVYNAPLLRVLKELERRYGTTIRLKISAKEAAEPLTLHYGQPVTLEDILRDISVMKGLQFRKVREGYVVIP